MDEVYAKSPLTGQWYRVTEWHEAGPGGKIVSNSKEEVDREEVPDEWVKAVENNMADTGTKEERNVE